LPHHCQCDKKHEGVKDLPVAAEVRVAVDEAIDMRNQTRRQQGSISTPFLVREPNDA
jgi:hypothetical protein